MELSDYFPIWDKLTPEEQRTLTGSVTERSASAGTVLHNGSADCVGLLAVKSGRLRAYILSDEGKEVSLYRLFERDICLFSASCMMPSIQFDVIIEAEKDSRLLVIPAEVYKKVMGTSAALANYTNELMASRFSEVMWLIEQIMWKSFDSRLAAFLLEESELAGSDCVEMTHDAAARHLGTAREVVTRMLRYFQNEGMVSLSRGGIKLTNRKALEALAE